jgi:hypothetical protein
MLSPTFDADAVLRLSERTEYEAWFLEAVYAISEQELFPVWPDAVIYPINHKEAKFFGYGRGNIVIGDWRPGFLNAGAPLVFISSFKLLDMFVEWVLEENGTPSTYRFQDKLRHLESSPTFPPRVESRDWLKRRLIGLYRNVEPLRGTIIHDRHFTSTGGAIRVSSSRGGTVGPVVELSAAELRILALTIISVLRYTDGSWSLDDVRDRTLRHDLDALVALHGQPLLGQRRPFHTRVRVYSADEDPRRVDPTAIKADLAARYLDQDCSFDLLVVVVTSGAVVDAYLFPWALFVVADPDWSRGINAEHYRTAIPADIDAEHLQ